MHSERGPCPPSRDSLRIVRRVTLAVLFLSAACERASATTAAPGSFQIEQPAGDPIVQGVFARAGGSPELLIDELFIAFDANRVRAGVRMLQAPNPDGPVEAKLCNVHLDTEVRWTHTGFVVSKTVDADGTIGAITIDTEKKDYAFSGSNCNVQLAAGEYGVTPQRDPDGNVIGILLTPPEGAAETWKTSRLLEIKDYAEATWSAASP